MAEIWQNLLNQGQMQTGLELLATVLALCYTVLAIRHHLWCWPAALISTLLTCYIMVQANLLTDALLQIYYALMAVYGWWQWQQLSQQHRDRKWVVQWSWAQHVKWILITACCGGILGYLMQRYTTTDFAWLGAQITCFAVFTTYLVTQKVLANWLYWIVIDLLSIYMYFAKELYFFSALFLIYTVTAATGYWAWRNHYQQQQQNSRSGIFASD